MKNITELRRIGIIRYIEFPHPQTYLYNGETLQALLWETLPKGMSKEDRLGISEALGSYSALPIITDKFRKHHVRREAMAKLPEGLRGSLEKNRLRISASNNLISIIELLEHFGLPEITERYSGCCSKYKALLQEYNGWSLHKKIALVRELTVFAKEVCVSIILLK